MKKNIIYILTILLAVFIFNINTYAKPVEFKCSAIKEKVECNSYEYEGCQWDNVSESCKENGDKIIDNTVNTNNCGTLGEFRQDLENILKAIRIVGPVLVVLLTVYEYMTVLFMKSADDLKKANKRLLNRLVLVALLFFLPTLLNLILQLIEGGDYTTCIN